MFVIECEEKKILHTGDFRLHGRKKDETLNNLKKIGKVDLLITEGTSLSRNILDYDTEEELEKNGYYKRIKETKIEDYFPNGKRRSEAEAMVPIIEYTAQFDGKIAQELSEYTDKISFYNNNQENHPNLNLTN